VCSRMIKRQKKAAKVNEAVALMDMKELEDKFRSAKKADRAAKKGHCESPIAFMDTFPAKDRDWIKQTEAAQEMGQMAKLITANLQSKKDTSVLYQGRTHNTKQGIDQVLIPMNEAKVWASEAPHSRSLLSVKSLETWEINRSKTRSSLPPISHHQEPRAEPSSFCNMPRSLPGLLIAHLESPRKTTFLL